MALLELPAAKSFLRLTSSTDDAKIQAMIDATRYVVERHLGQAVEQGTRTETRYNVSRTLYLWWPPVTELTSVVSIDGETVWDVADIYLEPSRGLIKANVGVDPQLYGDITVTYEAGMAEIPANITEAAKVIVQHMWETQNPGRSVDARFGPDEPIAPQGMGFVIPRRAEQLLGSRAPLVG